MPIRVSYDFSQMELSNVITLVALLFAAAMYFKKERVHDARVAPAAVRRGDEGVGENYTNSGKRVLAPANSAEDSFDSTSTVCEPVGATGESTTRLVKSALRRTVSLAPSPTIIEDTHGRSDTSGSPKDLYGALLTSARDVNHSGNSSAWRDPSLVPTELMDEASGPSIPRRTLLPARPAVPVTTRARSMSSLSSLTSLSATPPPSSHASTPYTPTASISSAHTSASLAPTEYEAFGDGQSVYERLKATRTVKTKEGPVTTVTFWFEQTSATEISAPPSPTDLPGLEHGDLFLHRTQNNNVYRSWMWSETGRKLPFWLEVSVGYVREDGRVLLMTHVNKKPSWVTSKHFKRMMGKNAATPTPQTTPRRSPRRL
ncbi:hypothetical protein C8Q79DRAFT_1006484 [Trametes meyenii]|nr:hypothetical protein C8Q79DRAFT_1006484 [Trametes meyenii]